MNIKKNTVTHAGCEFRAPWNITIGASVIGSNNVVDGRKGLIISDYVCTGSEATIWTLQHNIQSSTFAVEGGQTVLEDYV